MLFPSERSRLLKHHSSSLLKQNITPFSGDAITLVFLVARVTNVGLKRKILGELKPSTLSAVDIIEHDSKVEPCLLVTFPQCISSLSAKVQWLGSLGIID